jgi:hypothetical protein
MAMKSLNLSRVAVFTFALCQAVSGAANAGIILIDDSTDTLNVTGDTDVGARLTGITVVGETVTFEIDAPANASTIGVPFVSNLNILESDGTVSDTFQLTSATTLQTFWQFTSDDETPLQPLSNADSIVEDGTPQIGFEVLYFDANGDVFNTDTIRFKSDAASVPEPSSVVLAVIGLAMSLFMFRGSINRTRQG